MKMLPFLSCVRPSGRFTTSPNCLNRRGRKRASPQVSTAPSDAVMAHAASAHAVMPMVLFIFFPFLLG